MSNKKMLIDTTHPEETRVVVMSGNRIEDFEVEAADRKQLKGNIYLAKVTRVEPSLQAAFVDYGGNRHGFLAFSEIHPDYYQIPVADREALMAEQQAADRAAAAADDAQDEAATASAGKSRRRTKAKAAAEGEAEGEVEVIAGDEGEDVEVRRPMPALRNYKIQEVIKRRQIMLVQVVKEERGTKGAALTTYLSLAGRYCVLMPNTGRGGGISRKIASGTDRQRLKTILGELDIPEGMAVIVRTAGAKRNKTEIKRDCNYLLRLWESVRELTLQSIAPALVYEEANLIKRTIRDLYASDIDEIMVDGDGGFQTAKTFIRLLMPSHSKRVKQHPTEDVPLFQVHGVEAQLQGIFKPDVPLKSGGYIVINPTEALVSIDVNSGRATRERNIEETALRTNLEAADEVARQLRLREMAGLIVIDFIDMEQARNQIQVERRLKMAMRNDRARIQIGRISPFGLMELSRQRLHPSLLETCFEPFPHAAGVGYRRTVASSALAALRAIEEEGAKGLASELLVQVPTAVAVYIINHKRTALAAIEARHGMTVRFSADDALATPELRIERTVTLAEPRPPVAVRPVVEAQPETEAEDVEEAEEDVEEDAEDETEEDSDDKAAAHEQPAAAGEESHEINADGSKRRRRRRSRRRRGSNGERDGGAAVPHHSGESAPLYGEPTDHDEASVAQHADSMVESMESAPESAEGGHVDGEGDGDEQDRSRRRRRGRRGGRRRPREGVEATTPPMDSQPDSQPAYYEPRPDQSGHIEMFANTPGDTTEAASAEAEPAATTNEASAEGDHAPRRPRRRRSRSAPRETAETAGETTAPLPGFEVDEPESVAGRTPPAVIPTLPPGPKPYWASRPRIASEPEPVAEALSQPEVRSEPVTQDEPAVSTEPEFQRAPETAAASEETKPSSAAETATDRHEGAAEPAPAPQANDDPHVIEVDQPDPAQPARRGWWKRLVQS